MIFSLVHVAKKFLFAEHMAFILTIVLKPGGSTRDLADPGLKPGRAEEKIEEGKTWCDPVKNPVATRWFFFFTKTMSFWFKKKWPGRSGDPVKNQNQVLKL